ncbi:MAG: hypothetical protein EAZ08_08935 [Cytophagales bacterium]|nr:MAG: hypothetical protein EAZ08_08935 [Cytophagales bacterium]
MSFLRKKIIYLSVKQFVLFLIVVISFTACKKDADNVLDTPPPTDDLSKAKLALLDTMREIYYWNERVPAASQVNVRNYASVQATLDAFKHPTDRFSIIADLEKITKEFSGTPQDYGIGAFRADAQGNVRIGYVYEDSPLGKEGVMRGSILQKIGGQVPSNNNLGAELGKAQNTFEIRLLDGTVKTINASQATYKVNPVMTKNIITVGNKKIAYLAYNSFLGNPTEEQTRLSAIFGEFRQGGVSELVLDLRYNGGGYVSTMGHLANLIAPASANGKILSQQKWNATIQAQFGQQIQQQALRISRQPNSLSLQRVIIITTQGSASASEQIINNLKPYMNVVTVGSTTYGKPAFNSLFGYKPFGFYLTLGVMANANGEGDFFNGISPTITANDDVTRNFGDVQELSLKQALNYIETGSLSPINGRVESKNQSPIIGIENLRTWNILNELK